METYLASFMNFLAHILISIEDEEVMIGNFIGDFVKGSQMNAYSHKIQKGIRLHRAIDSYTDKHPIVMESKKRLRPQFRHYAPVIVDIFYDHFIARDWEHFHTVPLKAFTAIFYQTMTDYAAMMPQKVNDTLLFMKRENWLYQYQFMEGIQKTLVGMSRRTTFKSNMESAISSLEAHYQDFEKEFRSFFPELQTFAINFEA